MLQALLPPQFKRTRRCVATLVAISVVIVLISAWTGGFYSLLSARGSGSTDLEVTVDQPISAGLRARYLKTLAREKDFVVANPNHLEFRSKWRELNSDGTSDSVFFEFSTEPRLFGYRTRRTHHADIFIVWYQRDERKTFREVALPDSATRGTWKAVVPIVEP